MKILPKISLSVLLVIVMIIQPVVFSYAMADMNHNHHAVAESSDMNHQHMNHDDTLMSDYEPASVNNCCASPACGGAIASTISNSSSHFSFDYLLISNISRQSVVLSSETKPPQKISA